MTPLHAVPVRLEHIQQVIRVGITTVAKANGRTPIADMRAYLLANLSAVALADLAVLLATDVNDPQAVFRRASKVLHIDIGERRLEPCGTQPAWRRHMKAGEEPCAPCRHANRIHERNRKRVQRARMPKV